MQRFVESAIIDPKLFQKIDLSNSLKEKLGKLQRKLDTDSKKLVEAATEANRSAWEVPISMYDVKNANGRNYPRSLWERVINEQRHVWEGSPMLADHPSDDSDGDPSRICGVWLEGRVADDGYVYGTFLPSGSLGRDMEEHLRNGLKAGTSSSGFGDLLRDGCTVDPESFLIERLSDWVLTPSQGTYFTYEETSNEVKNASDSRFGESANKQESVVIEENKSMKLTKLEEKKFRRDMKDFLEDAQSISDPQERLKEFEEILSYLEEGAVPDLREDIENKINEERQVIKTQLEESTKIKEQLGVETADDLKKKLDGILEDVNNISKETQDWENIAKALQEKLDKVRGELKERPTPAYVTHLRANIKKLHLEKKKVAEAHAAIMQDLEEKYNKVKENLLGAKTRIKGLREQVAEKEKSIKSLEEKVTRIQQRAKVAEKKVADTEKEYNEYKVKIEESNKPKLMASPADQIAKHMNFREGESVENYWADLVSRHGADIKPFAQKIRSCKTVREAMAFYMKILPVLNEGADYEAARIPESVAFTGNERAAMLEKVGVHFEKPDSTKRLPKGWQ